METILIIFLVITALIYVFFYLKFKTKKPTNQFKNPDPIKARSNRDIESRKKEGIFELKAVNYNELTHCLPGDHVSLWKKPDMDYIIVYRHGKGIAGGAGKIGQVANRTFYHLAKYMDNGGRVEAKIANLMNSKCIIEYMIITGEEVELEDEQFWANRKEDLMKPYKPKKAYRTELYVDEKIKLRIGDKLRFNFQHKDYYLEKIKTFTLTLINNKDNSQVCDLQDQKDVRRPLKAFFNNYKLDITVIQKRGNYLTIEINPITNQAITKDNI